ncbi:PREDICTED: alpha-2-macroglobulin-like protein 1, partial [Nanorana parkeri]|uniref:alpha-2-macroglobulin-like protein 1 n=1 Tax=Nanorana parkeri TaxID=125878 RepID=UPI0008543FBE
MQLLLVSVCLVICSSALIAATDPHYVIIVPKKMEEGSQEKVCVTLEDLDGELHLKLELQKDDHVQNIAEQDVKTTDFSHCYSFQVPSVEHDATDWSFHVSGQGEHLKFDATRKVIIHKKVYSCVIQTDKTTYKPGDIVRFRLLSIDHNYQISNEKYEKILVQDTEGNFIGQWLDVTPDHGIVDLKYHLAKELKLGEYKLSVPSKCSEIFTVAEYVLKRFEVHINLPPIVASEAKSFHLGVCGSYTYGKPVQGNLDIQICNSRHALYSSYRQSSDDDDDDEHESGKCIKITHAKTDSDGCVSKEIDLHAFNFTDKDKNQHLYIASSLTEDGTGHMEKASADLYLSNRHKVEFVNTGMLYQIGVPFTGKIKVTNEEKQPMANATVVIAMTKGFFEMGVTLATQETNKDGVAHFALNTDSWTDSIVLTAGLQSEDGEPDMGMGRFEDSPNMLFVHPYYSESKSLLSVETIKDTLPCDSDFSVKVDYHITKDQLDSKTDHISFFYFTFNEDKVYSHQEYKLDITEQSSGSDLHGSFPIKVHLDAELSPEFFIVAYAILPKGETLGGINIFQTSVCFGNKVQLKFSDKQVHPGGKVNLEVSAEAGSLCSVRSVDKGYLLQYPSDDTSFATKVQQSISRSFGYAREYREEERHQCPENQTVVRSWHPTFDTLFLFETSGLILITNTHVRKPTECVQDGVSARSSTLKKKGESKDTSMSFTSTKEEIRQRFARSSFPDTWLYDLVLVGPDGHTVLNLTTPDSITKWETDAVCLGKSSIGEIRNVGLVTFQPYFIDLIIPYSVVQGEKFKIDAQIFSYEKKCILVAVSLSDIDGIHTVQSKDQARCVCNGHVSHFSWDATASKLDKIKIHVDSGSLEVEGDCKEDPFLITREHREDSVEKTIVVKARGYEEQTTETHLVCPADTIKKVAFTLNTPDQLVPGTERAHIIVIGDIMGHIVVNLENILPLPDGCGEQSVSKLSRYCSSLVYLQSSNELKPETKEKFLEHMVKGYQKQLTFRNDNGSFAAFSGAPSNLWITALVIRALSCAQQFIHVDEKIIQEAIHWLDTTQLPNGCFKTAESYFDHELDGDDDELARTAFILISLLEHQIVYNGSIVEHAKSCINKGAENAKTSHTLALLAYAFTLLGDSEHRALMLKRLDDHAEIKSGSKHWLGTSYRHGEVEISSYVIMALLSDKIMTHKDLQESAYAVRWLASEQNAWGGFSSSQDTTLALQALAKYAKTTNFKKGDSEVTVEDDSGFHKDIHVDQHNSLLVQMVDLPKVPGTYTASITGDGCVYIQSHIHYNSLPDEHDVHFALNVTTDSAVCSGDSQKNFEVHVDARYIGKRSKTNMAVIKAELLSGFEVDSKSIRKLEKHRNVEKVETSPGEIDIYLNELDHENKQFVFTVRQETVVENLQPANVLVYDYYIPVVNAHAQYNTPCVVAHCKVHASERMDCGRPLITKEQCEERGCCFDTSVVDAKWCFFH